MDTKAKFIIRGVSAAKKYIRQDLVVCNLQPPKKSVTKHLKCPNTEVDTQIAGCLQRCIL